MQRICGSILKISQRVTEAISKCKPVVALESTIISHGMPYPQNKQCALSIEKRVQSQGAVPATVAIFDGKIHVGLSQNQIQRLAETGPKVRKVSRRDLPYIIANKGIGATTVSATMIAAQAVGIDIFVTGGIGGVHRGVEQTMDVSADLDELARTPVIVVSAGVKSILDIPRTLEYLETKGVPVMTYKSQYFPAFFSASSGLLSPFVLQSELEAAKIIYSHQQLGLENGLLVAVPNNNPAEGEIIEKAIKQAIKQSQQQKIKGARITPFLLQRVNQITSGKSLLSNISLVHNNAEIGSKIAFQLAKLKRQARQLANRKFSMNAQNEGKGVNNGEIIQQQYKSKGKIIGIGCAGIDYHFHAVEGRKFEFYKSCPGTSRISLGGVARNIIECAHKLGIQTTLVSAIGNDPESDVIRKFCNKNGIKLVQVQRKIEDGNGSLQNIYNSAKYFAVMDKNNNELIAITEMQINDQLTLQNIYGGYFKNQSLLPNDHPQKIVKHDIIVLDSNAPEEQIRKIAKYCAQNFGCMIFFEGKGLKTRKIIKSGAYQYLSLVKINQGEKQQIEKAVKQLPTLDQYEKKNLSIKQWLGKNIGRKHPSSPTQIKSIITNGSSNVTIISRNQSNQILLTQLPVIKAVQVLKTTGAGDAFAGTYLSMILKGKKDQQALLYAKAASKINVQSLMGQSAISDQINMENLKRNVIIDE